MINNNHYLIYNNININYKEINIISIYNITYITYMKILYILK